jgi:hypothetical protein
MDVLQVPFTSAALLLAFAGVQKLRNPHEVSRALRLAKLPHHPSFVRGLAAVEIAAAICAMVIHHRLVPIVVAALYLSFAAFVTWVLARGLPIASCGCFGVADARPSPLHVSLNAFAATIATLVAVDDIDPVRSVIADDPAKGIGLFAASALLAAIATVWLRS